MKIRFVRGYPMIAEIEPRDLLVFVPARETDPEKIVKCCSPSVLQVAYRCSYVLYGDVFLKNRVGPLGYNYETADRLLGSSDDELSSGSWSRGL